MIYNSNVTKLKVKNLRKLGDIHKYEEIKEHTSK